MANGSANSTLQDVIEFDVDRRRRFVDLKPEDVERIRSLRDVVAGNADQHAAAFFNYLSQFEEATALFRNPNTLQEAKHLKHDHLLAMVAGEYGQAYVEQRVKLGWLYSGAGIDVRLFLGAFHHMMQSIGDKISEKFAKDPRAAAQHFASLNKIGFLDIGIIVDVLIGERERIIRAQEKALLELSTPALQLRDRLLMLPIIGVLDSVRAKQLTDGLLHSIRANRAKVVVMDITGVAAVDSRVANHLIQTVTAARLMGASVIVTGLSAEVAQSLVALGVDLSKVDTVGDLQGGIEQAERLLGYKVVASAETAAPRTRA
ncbi:MAG TPA: protoglobin domain-containing protein [Stellaceae bacterium]|nr:protoglobin domain-containing protein [Stellaceae bacterium]